MPDDDTAQRPAGPSEEPESAPPSALADMPQYKGAPLDAERGPGLGCFWIQVGLLAVLLVLTPLTVIAGVDSRLSAGLLVLTLVLLFFVGQTALFLLRLVAADRRSRRRPRSPQARRTVGQLEDEQSDEHRTDDPQSP